MADTKGRINKIVFIVPMVFNLKINFAKLTFLFAPPIPHHNPAFDPLHNHFLLLSPAELPRHFDRQSHR